ncbi:MAG: (Fe-S)-binding protein [Burkholderiales bacterium]|nr:(Fe-S)-binding protein [Burkholderiales bacterium]
MTETFSEALEARTQAVLDSCTRRGRCFEVCPMTAPAGIADKVAAKVVGGVLDIIRGGASSPESERWAQVCSGSGFCIPACPEAVNPRFMLALARVAMQRRATAEEQRSKGIAGFSNMGRAVRVLSRMQLPADVLRRFRWEGPAQTPPEVLFYTGCNVLKTPHIVLLALDILDALDVSYRVMGGPGNCCGVIQFRTGDFDASGRIAYRTTYRFAASGAGKVLAWCPTCMIQIGETVLPGRTAATGAPAYDLEAFVASCTSQAGSTGCALSCAAPSTSASACTSIRVSRGSARLQPGCCGRSLDSNTSTSRSRRWATCATCCSRCPRSSATCTAEYSKPPRQRKSMRSPASTTPATASFAATKPTGLSKW